MGMSGQGEPAHGRSALRRHEFGCDGFITGVCINV